VPGARVHLGLQQPCVGLAWLRAVHPSLPSPPLPTPICPTPVQFLVIDEADRILEVGFEEEMKQIVRILPKSRQTLLFSATQTKKVEDLARLSIQGTPECVGPCWFATGGGCGACVCGGGLLEAMEALS
jgi:hypothetical protein